MDNFLELEKKCKALKKKKYLKYGAIGGGAFFAMIVSAFMLFSKTTPEPKKNIEKPKIIEKKPKPQPIKEKPKQPIKKIEHKKEHKNIVPPMMEVEFDLNKINSNALKNSHKNTHKKTEPKPKKETPKKQIKKEEKKSNTMISSETITFNKALYLAKSAFNKHNYQESIKWCKIASNLNNDSAEVWRLYALNLVRLNQKQKAIIVLETYLQYKDSIKIKHLLQRLKK